MKQQRNVPARIDVNCPSGILDEFSKNRVVLLVDKEFENEFQDTIGDVYLTESGSLYMHRVPVINTIALKKAYPKVATSLTDIFLGRKRIHRVNPYPRELAKSFVFDNRMSNFKLTPSLKRAILASDQTIHPSVLHDMTTFGDLLDWAGPNKLKRIVHKMADHC